MGKTNRLAWFVFGFLAMAVSLYPLLYLFATEKFGLLYSKPTVLLENVFWNIGFYGHIVFGGVALATGWSQFSKKLRLKRIRLHKNLGKLYVFSAIVSGVCAVCIGTVATGGFVAALGFILLGLIWLYTSLAAYRAIRRKDISLHQGMMIYSYAACFAAVTLRLWLPLLQYLFADFIIAYRIVAWWCWVPNLIFAHFWVKRQGILLA